MLISSTFSGLLRTQFSQKIFIYVHIPKDGISCQLYSFTPQLTSKHNKPVYRLQQQSIRRLVLVPPYFVFCSISFRCGGLSIEHNQKPLTPESTLAVTHHDKQKQVEIKRSSHANPHEIRLFSSCPYYFTLPVNRDDNFFSKYFWQPCKKSRSLSVDVNHIVFAKRTTECCKSRR